MPESPRERSSLRFVLTSLRRMMEGERFRVADLAAPNTPFDGETVRRHLRLMEEVVPGVTSDGNWRTTWSFAWPAERRVAPSALLVARLAHTLLASLRGSLLDKQLEGMVRDMESRVTSDVARADVGRMFYAKSRMINPFEVDTHTVDGLANSIFEHRRIAFRYVHFDGSQEILTLEPFTLIFADEGLYCYGRCAESSDAQRAGERGLYNVLRIDHLSILPDRFLYPPPDSFSPDRLFGDCFGIFLPGSADEQPADITVSFARHWESYLKRHRWHKSQSKPRRRPDGAFEINLRVYLTDDLVRWLRGFGRDVEVVRPAELASWVASGVERVREG